MIFSLRCAACISWQSHPWVVSSAVICPQHVKLMGLWVLSPALAAICLSLWSPHPASQTNGIIIEVP